ncbi:integrase [Oenococcus sp.]
MQDKTEDYVQRATKAIDRKHHRILHYQTAENLFKQHVSS